MKRMTDSEKRTTYEAINALRAQGYTLNQAVRQYKTDTTRYYQWSKLFGSFISQQNNRVNPPAVLKMGERSEVIYFRGTQRDLENLTQLMNQRS